MQSHSRFVLALFGLAEFSSKSLSLNEIEPSWRSPEKCVPLAEIGWVWLAAGTVSGTPWRCELLDVLPDFSPELSWIGGNQTLGIVPVDHTVPDALPRGHGFRDRETSH